MQSCLIKKLAARPEYLAFSSVVITGVQQRRHFDSKHYELAVTVHSAVEVAYPCSLSLGSFLLDLSLAHLFVCDPWLVSQIFVAYFWCWCSILLLRQLLNETRNLRMTQLPQAWFSWSHQWTLSTFSLAWSRNTCRIGQLLMMSQLLLLFDLLSCWN